MLCQLPTDLDDAIEAVPEAVIEVISPRFEKKDLELNPPFYLSQGVKDVVVFDPATRHLWHFSADGEKQLQSPASISLSCGCTCTV